jgi:hypothetical protein
MSTRLIPVYHGIRDVHDARMFYRRHGTPMSQLFGSKFFRQVDTECLNRVCRENGDISTYLAASIAMRTHYGLYGSSDQRHAVSYNHMKLNNVYRVRDLWSRVI